MTDLYHVLGQYYYCWSDTISSSKSVTLGINVLTEIETAGKEGPLISAHAIPAFHIPQLKCMSCMYVHDNFMSDISVWHEYF